MHLHEPKVPVDQASATKRGVSLRMIAAKGKYLMPPRQNDGLAPVTGPPVGYFWNSKCYRSSARDTRAKYDVLPSRSGSVGLVFPLPPVLRYTHLILRYGRYLLASVFVDSEDGYN